MPSVLLSVDYESWFALTRRFDKISTAGRRKLDGGYAQNAIEPLLEQMQDASASFYLVGELVDWYPELPVKIAASGHEVGFHCQVHRPLTRLDDIASDLAASRGWRSRFGVTGFRAPMVNTIEAVYPLLKTEGFTYSSSIYAPAGTLLEKNGIREIPVSTLPLLRRPQKLRAPRNMTLPLILDGEFPYGSSFTIGLFEKTVLKIIEKELKRGLSPVIFLHPYELVRPEHWPARLRRDLFFHPGLIPFTRNKSRFLKTLLTNFSTSTLRDYLSDR